LESGIIGLGLMKLTVRGEYALRALTYLGRFYGSHVIRIQEVSEAEAIPKRFLEQILNDLRTGGFVESRRGIAGGYRLAKPPERIPLAAVVRHIEGALAPVGCVSENYYEKCNCPDENRCALRSVMKEVRDAVAGLMEKMTLADLVQRARQLLSEPASESDYTI
jgi:Rrf2 family protein